MNYKILAKYFKDLKFAIPSSKVYFLLSKNISNYKIKIDIKSKQIKEKVIEVETTLSLNPTKDDFEKIDIKIKKLNIQKEYQPRLLDLKFSKRLILRGDKKIIELL